MKLTCSNKLCSVGKPQPDTEFYNCPKSPGGKNRQCRTCVISKSRARKAKKIAESTTHLNEWTGGIIVQGKQSSSKMESIINLVATQSSNRIEQHFSY